MDGIFQWWLTFFLIGILFLPLSFYLFSSLLDKGYVFSKILGLIVGSYALFVLGMLHVLPFTTFTAKLTFAVIGIALFAWIYFIKKSFFTFLTLVKQSLPIFIFEEILFSAGLWYWSYIKAFNSDLNGLEKYMDFGFVNSILRTTYFPPADMWFTPLPINYYYFGHLFTAVTIKLSSVIPSVGYNLMLATLFAFTFTLSFSIATTLFSLTIPTPVVPEKKTPPRPLLIKRKETSSVLKKISGSLNKQKFIILFTGLLTGLLVSHSGNLHSIYAFFKAYSTEDPVPFWKLDLLVKSIPNGYWYPNATRFIHNTIHEFPLYSFVVSDLHGHVLDIPIVLTIVAFLLHLFTINAVSIPSVLFLGFFIAVAYMTNAWDGIIYMLLSAIIVVYIITKEFTQHIKKIKHNLLVIKHPLYITRNIFYIALLILSFVLFSLPFSLHFKPFVSGIGVLCAPQFLITKAASNNGHIGPFLFEQDHCQHSPLWQLAILHGFFYFWVIIFFILLFLKKKIIRPDIFVIFLIIIATMLILIPEFIYAKDIYPAHYRANTMFKLVYQAFILLSIVSAFVTVRFLTSFKLIFFIKKIKSIYATLSYSGIYFVLPRI
jgi:YYY domain-containing protein